LGQSRYLCWDILSFCTQWQLTSLSDFIEESLVKNFEKFSGNLTRGDVLFVRMANAFNLKLLLCLFMNKDPYVPRPRTAKKNLMLANVFQNLERTLKYEILKNTIMRETVHMPGSKEFLELKIILNFLDALIYEDKILDNSTYNSRKRRLEWDFNFKNSKKQKTSYNSFQIKTPATDVQLLVGDVKLYVNSFTLTENSPVFKVMLQSTFRESQEKLIQLPGKNVTEVVSFLTFMLYHGEINRNTDVFSLCKLFHEYQVDWLSDKVMEYLKTFIVQEKPQYQSQTILNYISLALFMQWESIEKQFLDQLTDSFVMLQTLSEFNALDLRLKVLIARKRLWVLLSGKSLDKTFIETLLNTRDFGMVSVLRNYQQDKLFTLAEAKVTTEGCGKLTADVPDDLLPDWFDHEEDY